MTPRRGNPELRIRFEPEAIEEVQEAFPAVKGRSGGVALALRRLLYLALDKPMPRQFGEIGRAKEIDELEDLVRQLETPPTDLTLAGPAAQRAREALKGHDLDPVDRLRLRAVLGRLAFLETAES